MFSRILASESPAVPTAHSGLKREPSSTTRLATSSCRCILIMLVMYRRSRSPSSSKTSSWIASNSRPSSSSCSSVRRDSGLSIISSMESSVLKSQGDLDGAFGRVHAGADHLALGARDLAGAQVAHLARAELSDAGVADAHAASEGERAARLLAGHEDRLRAVARGLEVRVQELDRAAVAVLGVLAADDGLETLHVQPVAVAVL